MSKKNTNIDPQLARAILGVFKDYTTKSLNYKQVAARIEGFFEKNDILDALEQLVKEEKIASGGRGKYHYIHEHTLIEGTLQVVQSGAGFLIADEGDEKDIFIASRDLNKGFNGDRVTVNVFARKKGKRLEGEVVSILRRAKLRFVGVIQRSKDFSFFVGDDKRLYVDIFVPNDMLNKANDGDKVIVEITDWPDKAKNPFGKVVQVLGEPGLHETEMHAIIAEFGFATEFPPAVLAESEAIPETIPPAEIKKRRDFRDILTFTIDPADAKDFDDAISFKRLPNGHYEIGVHIADVSHYVRPGTQLDADAFDRATSVYLVDRTIPMLPEKLSNGVCSLRPHEDKLTFSAVFEMNDQGHVLHEWFGKTVIHSDQRFSYEEAQELIENPEGKYGDILVLLNNIAKTLREERYKRGAISFETEEVKFRLDEDGTPLEVYKKVRKDAHKLIEEYMLLANRKVAEYPFKKGQADGKKYPFVYRVHDSPNEEKLVEFSKFIKRFGYEIKTGSDQQIATSFNKLLADVEGKPEQNVLQSMAIRTMAKAIYTIKKSGHYGLAFDHYSHFTSPIRRYPDLMTHRLLETYLEGRMVPDDVLANLEKQCKHSSEMEQKAAEAERASTKYKQAEYLQKYIGRVFDGVISGVTEWGIYVELTENKCEGMIRLNTIFDDFYEYDEEQQAVVGKSKKRKFRIGDKVKVQVKRTDPIKRTIDFVMA